MTDAINGSGEPGNPAAQTPPPGNGSTEGGAPLWLDGLSEGNRELAKNKGWTAPEHLDKAFTSYAELEGKLGQSLTIPKPDAQPEEWDRFYSRVGRPDSADKYEFKRPENLPADALYSDELANTSKTWMHKAGLNSKQAQSVHDEFVGYMAQQQEAAKARQDAAVVATHDELVKDWGGPPDSAPFKEKLALADRAMKRLGLTEAYQKVGILLPDGSLTNPQIAKAFALVGETMFKEDTISNDGAAFTGENPFKRDAAGKIKSPSAISALIKSDPERAKQMARAAGEPVERWFPENPL